MKAEFDLLEADRSRRRSSSYNVVQIPLLRLVGLTLVAIGVLVHNYFFLRIFSWTEFLEIASIQVGYSLASWLILYLYYEKFKLFNLGEFFLHLDVLLLVVAVYYSGGERSWLFFLLIFRTVDQASRSFRTVMAFAHESVFAYVLLIFYLVFVEHRDISVPTEISKVFILYAANLYIALTAVQALRNRTIAAMRVARDLTAQLREKSDQLEESKNKAEAANLAKSQFLAIVSHELRTPLTAVIGFANVLMKDKNKKLDSHEILYLERIVENGKHLLRIINDILDLTKIETGHLALEIGPVPLEALVRQIFAEFEEQIREKDLSLRMECHDHTAKLETDQVKLKQVLLNLIGNGIKFTEKGSVTVRVQVNEATRVPSRIDVIDTGIGIPSDRLESVFDAFQQVDNTNARAYGGAGLGLTISRSLCGLMGYRLTLESKVGHGSTFSIHLN